MATWVLLDLLTGWSATSGHLSAWHFAAALTFYLFFTFGVRYAYAPILASIASTVLLDGANRTSVTSHIATSLIGIVVYGIAALFLRRVLHIRAPFRRLRDFLWYLLIGTVAVAFVASASTLISLALGTTSAFGTAFVAFAITNFVGIITLVPALIILVSPTFSRRPFDDNEAQAPLPPHELLLISGAILISAFLGFRIVDLTDAAPMYYFLFLPLMWLAARGGLRYAVAGILLADLSIMGMNAIWHLSVAESVAYQSYLAASALTALTLGVIVSQRRREERDALDRARCDNVTGLPTPQALDAWFSHPRAKTYPALTLLLLEIDNMRWVNEGLHRAAIDDFMRGVGDRLRNAHVGALFLAHVSGHEFAVILEDEDRHTAALVAEKIRRGFERPIPVENEEIYATLSVGIATCRTATEDPRLLVPHAEQALDAARVRGLESVAFFTGEKPREKLFSLASQLHDALRGGEFDLWFQPLFEVLGPLNGAHPTSNARIVGAEALLRWNHPRRGLIEPESFLDMLDSMSLSERVGGWVLDNALMHVANWRKRGNEIAVWINVFGRQLVDPEFFGSLRGRLLRYDLTPSSLVLEVTERIIAREEAEVVAIVNKLRSAGVRVAIDDFGTGHSTLARLQNIPFDIVKIDQSFIRGIEADSRSSGVVTTLIALARELDATIVAEGIETDGQLDFLVRSGCHTIQGYRLGLPMPASEFESLLRRSSVSH